MPVTRSKLTKAERKKRNHKARNQARRAIRALEASGGSLMKVECSSIDVVQAAGDGEDGGSDLREFDIVVYTGGKMYPRGFPYPAVLELGGTRVMRGVRPALFNHDSTRPVGHTPKVAIKTGKQGRITTRAIMSVPGEDRDRIVESSDNGYPWKASMGLRMDDVRFVKSGDTFYANGRQWRGPCYYVKRGTYYETSFVTVAGDNTSSATLAASMANNLENLPMNFQEWLVASGFDPETLDDNQMKILRASYNAEQNSDGDGDGEGSGGGDGGSPNLTAGTGNNQGQLNALPQEVIAGIGDIVQNQMQSAQQQMRTEAAAESTRISRLNTLCAGLGDDVTVETNGVKQPLLAAAIEHGWSPDQAELHILRAGRGSAPNIHSGTPAPTAQVLEASLAQSIGMLDDEQLTAAYGEQVMDQTVNHNGMGLQDLAAACCDLEGVSRPRYFGSGRETLNAAFSTNSLSHITTGVLNRSLVPIYEQFEVFAMQIAKVIRANDYRQIERVNLLGSGQWQRVGATGELASGRISDEKFTNQPETFGQYLALSFQDFKNDDLGALNRISEYMAIMGTSIIDDTFFYKFLANANSFISAGNGNIATNKVFGLEGLSLTKTLFRKRKVDGGSQAKDARRINVRPEIILCPVELEDEVTSFLGSPNMIMKDRKASATVGSKTGDKNPHYQKYRIVSPPHISDTDLHSNASAFAYYLLSNPNLIAAYTLAFVDGITRPTIESVDPGPNVLGLGFRGHISFGVGQENKVGIVKNVGTTA